MHNNNNENSKSCWMFARPTTVKFVEPAGHLESAITPPFPTTSPHPLPFPFPMFPAYLSPLLLSALLLSPPHFSPTSLSTPMCLYPAFLHSHSPLLPHHSPSHPFHSLPPHSLSFLSILHLPFPSSPTHSIHYFKQWHPFWRSP